MKNFGTKKIMILNETNEWYENKMTVQENTTSFRHKEVIIVHLWDGIRFVEFSLVSDR